MEDLLNRIIHGNALSVLQEMPDKIFNCVVTSSPYFWPRDYKVPEVDWPVVTYSPMPGLPPISIPEWGGCLGLEPTPEMYVGHMVLIFREVFRVLRDDGTLWFNIGDSYTGSGKGGGNKNRRERSSEVFLPGRTPTIPYLKNKNLIGIPWRVAFALQAYGWCLRSDIIWHKPNPTPESVTDRPTRAHEAIFLFSKQRKYYYDYEAIREPVAESSHIRVNQTTFSQQKGGEKDYRNGVNSNRSVRKTLENFKENFDGYRNKRSVWTVSTGRYNGAHFATFPPDLIKPCILAGCPVDGIVLDPFIGSGTTGMVARALGRNYTGIDLNESYIKEIAEPRIKKTAKEV